MLSEEITMCKPRFNEHQIITVLKFVEAGRAGQILYIFICTEA